MAIVCAKVFYRKIFSGHSKLNLVFKIKGVGGFFISIYIET